MKKIAIAISLIIATLLLCTTAFATENNIKDIKYYETLVKDTKTVTILLNKNTQSRKVTKKEVMEYDTKIKEIKNDKGTILKDSELVKTGDYVTVNNEDYQVILYGDANKDGYICDIEDIMIVRNNYLGTNKISEIEKVVANLENNDEILDIEDMMKMIDTFLGKNKNEIISKTPENYISFDNNKPDDGSQDENKPDDGSQDENKPDDGSQDENKPDDGKEDDNKKTTPVEVHGKLQVNGTNIVDKNGNKFQLKGVSTHGIQWFPQYINKAAFVYMRDEWNINAIRLAMYSNPNDGYNTNLHKRIEEGVKYATDSGMYVIIDWHILNDGNPNTNKEAAIKFFEEMSEKYKDYDNVIYEICNEPNGDVQWKRDIKPYAEDIIKVIRNNDKDAIIVVGTPTWSQDVDVVANSPIEGYDNIMYTLHFYAGTHKEYLRQKATAALNAGLPIFVTEFGISDASGNGNLDKEEGNKWIDFLNENNISWMCWSLCNKDESSALLKNTDKITNWTEDELSEQGKWLLQALKR